MNSYEYIEKVKENNNLDTDYKAAKMLGWRQHKITNYKNGQTMDNNAARQIAQILNLPVLDIIIDMEAIRAKDEPTKKAWKMLNKLQKQDGHVSANLLIVLGIIFSGVQYCILCKIANVSKRLLWNVSPSYQLV